MNENRYATESFAREYEQILSPCYLSPEELAGKTLDLEGLKRSDLFKLGCVLLAEQLREWRGSEARDEWVDDPAGTHARGRLCGL